MSEDDDKVVMLINDKTVGMDQLCSFDSRGVPGPGVTCEMAFAEVKRLMAERNAWLIEAGDLTDKITQLRTENERLKAEIEKRDAALTKDLRNAFLKDPARFRAAVLTKRQLEIVRHIKALRQATATDIAGWLGVSIQNASTQLTRLHRKEYLDRAEQPDPSGGYFYIYTPSQSLVEQVTK